MEGRPGRPSVTWSGELVKGVLPPCTSLSPHSPLYASNPCLSLYYSTALTIQAMPPPFRGCGQQSKFHNPNIDLTLFVFGGTSSILTEAIALILTWIRLAGIMGTLRTFKLQIGVSRMICIDGTLYSSVLLVLLGMDMLSIPDQSFNNIPALTDTLASISLSRFILNLRAISLASEGNTCSAPSSVVFNSKRESSYLVGNLGATLRAFDDDDNDEGEEMDASSAIIDICTDGPFNQWVSDDPFMAGIIADAMASSCKSSCSTLDGQ
ncbi:hypothetical protein PsYK624_094770 [Phanerochaete sordida]|uniref:Uncharacterized protein n=1 Tax=Phanerochaete sordida TaxID=48140 RepID=A0A9P3GC04_9APHY|nr:hypothetical protein PsYK624_094770 [Phanerochaete sordida]